MKKLMLTYDRDSQFPATPEWIAAVENLLRAELAMMQAVDGQYRDCWTWGEAVVGDVASASHLQFFFGGDDEKPEGMTEDVRVRLADTSASNSPA